MYKRSQKRGGQQHVNNNVRHWRAVLCREPKAQLNIVLTWDNELKPHFHTAPIVAGFTGLSKSTGGQWHETKEMGCACCHWLNWHVVVVIQQSWPLRAGQHIRTEDLTSRIKEWISHNNKPTHRFLCLCSRVCRPKIEVHKVHLMRLTQRLLLECHGAVKLNAAQSHCQRERDFRPT